jgi:hypothetical protein
MATAWFTVLKSVPWSTVISNAPAVADGAKKLWKAVAKRSPSPQPPATGEAVAAVSGEAAVATLRTQLATVELATSRLEEQMLASSELIKALAEQNTLLIGLVEANGLRTLWLARAVAVLGVVAAAELVGFFVRL